MNAYLVRIPEERADFPSACDLEPPEPWWPTGIFVAATPAQAKRDALRAWTSSRSGVYSDDWNALRVRLLERDVDLLGDPLPRGELCEAASAHFDRLWLRVHEALDHDGRLCDCPEEIAA